MRPSSGSQATTKAIIRREGSPLPDPSRIRLTTRRPPRESPDVSAKGTIWSAHARITNETALKALLAALPDTISAAVQELARAGWNKTGMRYDAPSRQAFWLQHGSDGVLSCYTFEDVADINIATELWRLFDDASPMSEQQMYRIFSAVTGNALGACAGDGSNTKS
jgi:hypothetical protein